MSSLSKFYEYKHEADTISEALGIQDDAFEKAKEIHIKIKTINESFSSYYETIVNLSDEDLAIYLPFLLSTLMGDNQ